MEEKSVYSSDVKREEYVSLSKHGYNGVEPAGRFNRADGNQTRF